MEVHFFHVVWGMKIDFNIFQCFFSLSFYFRVSKQKHDRQCTLYSGQAFMDSEVVKFTLTLFGVILLFFASWQINFLIQRV